MFEFESETEDSNDIEPRLLRALEEPLSVVSTDGTPVDGDASIVSVVSHSGESYTVDVRDGRCDCPDAQYNLDADQRCKHQFRAEIATGRTPVPVRAVETADVDSCFGDHTQSSVRFLASDGGIIDGDSEMTGTNSPRVCRELGCEREATHTVNVNAPGRGYAEDPACQEHAEEAKSHIYVREVKEHRQHLSND